MSKGIKSKDKRLNIGNGTKYGQMLRPRKGQVKAMKALARSSGYISKASIDTVRHDAANLRRAADAFALYEGLADLNADKADEVNIVKYLDARDEFLDELSDFDDDFEFTEPPSWVDDTSYSFTADTEVSVLAARDANDLYESAINELIYNFD